MADQKPPVEIVHTNDTQQDDIGTGQSVAPQVSPPANQPEMPVAVETAAPPAYESHSHWCEQCHARRFDCLCKDGQWGVCPKCFDRQAPYPYLYRVAGRLEIGSGFGVAGVGVDGISIDGALGALHGRNVVITVREL